MAKQQTVLELIESFGLDLTKAAEAESGETKPASTGSRASENASDVKAAVPNSVDAAGNNESGSAGENTPLNSIGTKKDETGVNVPTTKDTKDDPGTSHPAKAGGEKYAASTDALLAGGNELLAEIALLSKAASAKPAAPATVKVPAEVKDEKDPVADATKPPAEKAAVAKPAVPAAKPAEKQAASADEVLVKSAELNSLREDSKCWQEMLGYLVGQQVTNDMIKAAADEPVAAAVTDAELVKVAQEEAALTVALAHRHADNLVNCLLAEKRANEMAGDPAALAALQGGGGDAGGGDPMAMLGGGGGGAPGQPGAGGEEIDPELLMLLLQALQEQGAGGGDVAGAGNALQGLGGGDPAAAAGGAPGGDAVDDARAAAAGEPGSDDETKGAKTESNEPKKEEAKEESKEASASIDKKKLAQVFAQFVKAAAAKAPKQK